jgi:sulfur-oxidizing protein SoxZ
MASNSIKIRARAKGNAVTVKALIKHPMETGMRKDKKTGKKIPAHFIQEVTCKANGKQVLLAEWGPSVSKNPYLSFTFDGAKGETVSLSWVDNTGQSDSKEVKVK